MVYGEKFRCARSFRSRNECLLAFEQRRKGYADNDLQKLAKLCRFCGS
jgi:hypothetical protein